MKIRNHSTSNKYFVVSDPTEAAIARMKQLTAWGKIQENGLLIVHNNFRHEFDDLVRRHEHDTTIAPNFTSVDELEQWLWNNLNSSKLADRLSRLHPQVWNREYAGKAISEIEG